MINNNIHITIITLTKNDNNKFKRTAKSINNQVPFISTEWLIIDGSSNKIQQKNKSLIHKYFCNNIINIRIINSTQLKINGIYQCMNYAKKEAYGKFILFLNSGDEFYDRNSLNILSNKSKNINSNLSVIFGQANIYSSNKINWYFPGKRLKNIKNWLRFFEPNHQSMLISRELANKYDFEYKYYFIADGYWKRKILKKASQIIYINYPICKFFLDGISSIKPSKKEMIHILRNRNISILRKIIFIIKFIFPSKLFYFYHLLQKIKSNLIDLLL